ncbi:hypothetical protein M2275_006766 [Rhodococcus opacus]|nr:hypothetical protein [Rhodococcus opacus]
MTLYDVFPWLQPVWQGAIDLWLEFWWPGPL